MFHMLLFPAALATLALTAYGAPTTTTTTTTTVDPFADRRAGWEARRHIAERGPGALPHQVPMDDDARAACLDIHNKYRNETSAELVPLVWDMGLEAVAQRYADMCEYVHHPGNPYGENLWIGWAPEFKSAAESGLAANRFWHTELEAGYVDPEWKCINNHDPLAPCGHYSQQVWADSRKLGCAMTQNCFMFGNYWTLVYCEYDPSGNQMSQFNPQWDNWVPYQAYNEEEEMKS